MQCDIVRIMTFRKNSIILFFAVLALLLITTAYSCALFFDYDAYDYSLNKLKVGVAFPLVRNESETANTVAHIEDLGLDYVRIGCDWSFREPVEDQFSWNSIDYRLNAFSKAGIKVLLSIETHNWPDWLKDLDAEHDDTKTLQEFREFVTELLRLYGTKIERIQAGNEWNWEIDEYFNGSEEAYIKYANILSEEVNLFRTENNLTKPTIVLGSFSARHALAYDQNLISQITIEGEAVYQDELTSYAALPVEDRMTSRVQNILSNASYEMLDIHFYDDYPDWNTHLTAFRNACRASGGDYNTPVIVSEFGGPYPADLYSQFGRPSENLLAERLVNYMHTLDSLNIMEAYFFKLQQGSADIAHPDSYLLNFLGGKTPAYNVMKNFGNQN